MNTLRETIKNCTAKTQRKEILEILKSVSGESNRKKRKEAQRDVEELP
jgi:hypothetical protein